MNTLIGVLDKVNIGIPVNAMFEHREFSGGAVGQFCHLATPKEKMTLASEIMSSLEKEGYSFSKKATNNHGLLAYQKGKFFVGLLVGGSKDIKIYHEEAQS